MIGIDYKELRNKLQALTPLCNFEMPSALCSDKELYFRRHYTWMDEEIANLVDLAIPLTIP